MEKCTLLGLGHHEPPYALSFQHLQLNDKVTTEYRGIMAQSCTQEIMLNWMSLVRWVLGYLCAYAITFSLGLVSYSQSASCLLDRQFVLSSTNFRSLVHCTSNENIL